MRFLSFFTGHKASVLALAGHPEDKYFYSVGADGLVVRWSVDKPDEGDVITRFNGIVPSMVFDKESEVLYCALNQKGVVVLDCKTGKEKATISIPSTSFFSIKHSESKLVVSTNKGELLLIDKEIPKMTKRIGTGLGKGLPFELSNEVFWYSGKCGLSWVKLENDEAKLDAINGENNVVILYMNEQVAMFNEEELELQSIKKPGKSVVRLPFEDKVAKAIGGVNAPNVVALLSNGNLATIEVDKKIASISTRVENMHIGAINDLLWSENYKFVVTAGADKKIGIWSFN